MIFSSETSTITFNTSKCELSTETYLISPEICLLFIWLIIKSKKYKYEVWEIFLKEEHSYNSQIFLDLKLDKVKFANSAYGYDSDGGDWPNSKFRDFAALTRLVEALFPYCDKVTVNDEVVYSLSKKPAFEEVSVPFFEVESYSSKSKSWYCFKFSTTFTI